VYCLSNNLFFDAFKKQFSRSRQTTKRVQSQSSKYFTPVQLIDTPASQAIEFVFTSGVVVKISSSAPLHSVAKKKADEKHCRLTYLVKKFIIDYLKIKNNVPAVVS
jgi:hypothetical protein